MKKDELLENNKLHDDFLNPIYDLKWSDKYYYVDYVPYNSFSDDFLDLENYLEDTYLKEYSKKIARVILKIIYHYDCIVFINEFSKNINLKYKFEVETDLRYIGAKKLDYLIQNIILKDFSELNIYLKETGTIICVSAWFSVVILNLHNDNYNLIKTLIEQENYYLKYRDESKE